MPSSDLTVVETRDGEKYQRIPEIEHEGDTASVELKCIQEPKHIDLSQVGAYNVYHTYVKVQEIREKGLLIDADPRKPEYSDQVGEMVDTLEEAPKDFVKFNNGISVLCRRVEQEKDTIRLNFGYSEGICNGGHTYFSFYQADSVGDAAVQLEIIEIPGDIPQRQQEITDIAQARNNTNQLDTRSVANFLGRFDPFKRVLCDPQVVEWNEGDPRAHSNEFTSVNFIRLLKCWDLTSYSHPVFNPNAGSHRQLAVTRTRILKNWNKQVREAESEQERPFHYLVPMVNDLLHIRDYISYELSEERVDGNTRQLKIYDDYINSDDKTRKLHYFEGDKVGVKPPYPIEVLFIGAYRSNIYLSSSPTERNPPQYIGWYLDIEEVWEYGFDSKIRGLNDDYKKLENPTRRFKRIDAPYRTNFYTLNLGRDPDPPNRFYDREADDKRVYKQAEDGEYWLEYVEDEEDVLHRVDDTEPPSDQVRYTKTNLSEVIPVCGNGE